MKGSVFWDKIVPRLLSSYAALSFLILWIGMAAALIINPDWLESLWNWFQTLPSLLRILVWVFLTPLMTALWIWNSDWGTFLKLLAYAGIAGWTALAISSFKKAFWHDPGQGSSSF